MFGSIDQPRSSDTLPKSGATGREKYEFEASSGRPFAKIAAGFVVFEALLLLKNILFGTQPGGAAQASVPPTMSERGQTSTADAAAARPADHFVEPGEQAPPTVAEMMAWMMPKIGSSTFVVDPFGGVTLVRFDGGKATAGPALVVSNDNLPTVSPTLHLPDTFHFSPSAGLALVDSGSDAADPEDDAPPLGDDSVRRNTAPVVSGDTIIYRALVGQTAILGAAELLLFAHDIDGDALSIASATANAGTVEVSADGEVRYRPPSMDFIGTVVVKFEISDGEQSVSQIAQIEFGQIPGSVIIGTVNRAGNTGGCFV
ncbi:MAG: cadherin-like domain-containing protein [Hyphomicrobiaceae bacterium]